MAWWKQGQHVVLVIGMQPVRRTLARIDEGRPNLTGTPLYRKSAGAVRYETYCRGYLDVPRLLEMIPVAVEGDSKVTQFLNRLVVQMVVEQLGLDGLTGLSWNWGFEGEYQRGTTVLHVTPRASRHGLLKLVSAPATLDLKSLPSLPPDVSSVSVHHIEWGTWFDGIRDLYRLAQIGQRLEEGKNLFSRCKDLDAEVRDVLGFDLRKELLEGLAPTVVAYQAGSEGPFSLGNVLAIQVKDARRVERALEKLPRILQQQAGAPEARLLRHTYLGVAYHVLQVKGLPVAPSFVLHDGWLMMALYPQPVKAAIWRTRHPGAAWQVPAVTTQAITRGLQAGKPGSKLAYLTVTDSRPFLDFLLPLVPVGAQVLAGSVDAGEAINLDVSALPPTKAVLELLTPNVTACFDDGDALRWESHSTLELPSLLETYCLLGYFGVGVNSVEQRWQMPTMSQGGLSPMSNWTPGMTLPSAQYFNQPPQSIPTSAPATPAGALQPPAIPSENPPAVYPRPGTGTTAPAAPRPRPH